MLHISCLITGASGFIGRNLCQYLSPKYRIFAPSHKELDLLDAEKVRRYIGKNKIKIIIHSANTGGGRDTLRLPNVIETNLRMFFNIARNASLVEKIINFGSGAEYDKSRPLVKIGEEEFDKRVPADDYGFYKYVSSKYIEKSEKIYCLRLFGVYGKYENYLYKFISNTMVKNLLRMPITIGQNVYFDYLYIDDLVRIVEYFILNRPKYKIYNTTRGEEVDLLTIARTVNDISDYKSEIKILNHGLNLTYTGDNKRLKEEIGNFKFTPLRKGIEELYNWYKKNLAKLDLVKVRKDPYLGKIKVKHKK